MTDKAATLDRARRVALVIWSSVGALILIAVALWAGAQIYIIFPPLALALGVVLVVNPLVERFRRVGLHRVLAAVVAYLVFIAVIVIAGLLAVPPVVDQAQELRDRFPELLADVRTGVEDLGDRIGVDLTVPRAGSIQEWLDDPDNQDLIRNQIGTALDATLNVLEWVLIIILAPVLAFYLLVDLPTTAEHLRNLVPERHRAEVIHVFGNVTTALGGYVRGQLAVAAIVAVMMSIGFWLIDLPFWLIIGLISGFLNIVPFVGPWVGGALGALAGLTSGTPSLALWAILVAVIVQQIDNNFISPVVLKVTVRLHPVTIILALLAGGAVAGFFGVLVAVPTVAIFKIVLGHLWRTRVLGESWEQAEEALLEVHEPDTGLMARLGTDRTEVEGGEAPGDSDVASD